MKQIRLMLMIILIVGGLLVACDGTDQKDQPKATQTLSYVLPTSADDAESGAKARSTREAQQTAEAQSTLVAGRTATQKAASESATAEAAQDAATVTAMARVTEQAVFSVSKQWKPTLIESFANNALEWPLGVTTDSSPVITSTIANGSYQWAVIVRDGSSYINLVPEKSPIFSAFSASVDITFGDGPEDDNTTYGLVFRHVGKRYGLLGISRMGTLRILEVHDGGISYQDTLSLEDIDISVGKPIKLTVIAIGPDFIFLVNDKVVGQRVMELAAGQIGFGADAPEKQYEQAKVSFSNLQVSEP